MLQWHYCLHATVLLWNFTKMENVLSISFGNVSMHPFIVILFCIERMLNDWHDVIEARVLKESHCEAKREKKINIWQKWRNSEIMSSESSSLAGVLLSTEISGLQKIFHIFSMDLKIHGCSLAILFKTWNHWIM